MTTWQSKRIRVEREFEITDAPDLQDTTSKRRMVLRPRTVTLHQEYGTNQIRYATIEGRQVRRDGEPAGSKMILCGSGSDRWRSAAPPPWLNKIMADNGLEWA